MKTYKITFTDEITVNDDIDGQGAIEQFLIDIENEPQKDILSHIVERLKAN